MREYTVDEMFQMGVQNYERIETLVGYTLPEQVDTSDYCDRIFTEEECQEIAAHIRATCPPVKKFYPSLPEEDFTTSCRMGAILSAEIDAGIEKTAFILRLVIITLATVYGVFFK